MPSHVGGRAVGRHVRIGVLLLGLVVALIDVVTPTRPAEAVDGSQWQAGNIISDAEFFNGSAMSAAEVQSFLNSKGANCVANSEPCLKNYTTSTPATQSESGLCAAMPATSSSTGAQIIYNVGKACGISQKVMLVMIQKESSIVTTSSPQDWMYEKTAGFACPDTAPCDTQYYGYFNQVYRMARQFKYYAANPTRYGYQAGRNNTILYNPNHSCGSGTVYIQNQATANLYIYTPYQPNAAALANMYGEGDSCSAYGNRNFWRFYTDWFKGGGAQPVINPQGALESASAGQDGDIRMVGWAYDGSAPTQAVTVRLTVNGTQVSAVTANRPRPELAYYGIPGNHGYDVTIKGLVHGQNNVCATAVDIGGGNDVQLGCKTVNAQFASIDPIGALDSAKVSSSGKIAVKGWAYDGSKWDAAVPVMITVNGQIQAYASAGDPYPALASYGIAGDNGFSTEAMPVANGNNQVCAFAVNILGGNHQQVGCKSVQATVPGSPTGEVQSATQDGSGNVTVSGYAYDPSAVTSSVVTVIVENGKPIAYLYADKPTPDLSPYGIPGKHGFSWTFKPSVGGNVSYCAYAANIGAGADNYIGCKYLNVVPPGSPQGDFESLTSANGQLTMSGWAWDQNNATGPVTLMVTVNGQVSAFLYADQPKPVLAAYGIPGQHAFKYTFSPPKSSGNSVCVYAFNQGPGADRLLGCRTK